ncbi:hypothetical protein CRUP_030099 [Coryphaenoides rupestris]|nr:hypothetical protein CRUP_030099 [Coryphaenoides rupestris]
MFIAATAKQCDAKPCKNRGACKEGWNRYICDCTGTGFWARTCERGESLYSGKAPRFLQGLASHCFAVALLQDGRTPVAFCAWATRRTSLLRPSMKRSRTHPT